jgi:hypothetical protein
MAVQEGAGPLDRRLLLFPRRVIVVVVVVVVVVVNERPFCLAPRRARLIRATGSKPGWDNWCSGPT